MTPAKRSVHLRSRDLLKKYCQKCAALQVKGLKLFNNKASKNPKTDPVYGERFAIHFVTDIEGYTLYFCFLIIFFFFWFTCFHGRGYN